MNFKSSCFAYNIIFRKECKIKMEVRMYSQNIDKDIKKLVTEIGLGFGRSTSGIIDTQLGQGKF